VVAQAKRFSQEIVKGIKRSADVLQQAALEGMKKEPRRGNLWVTASVSERSW
jgi:hypothetical protein